MILGARTRTTYEVKSGISFLLFLFPFLFHVPLWAESNLCGHIFVQEGKIQLDNNERALVCGSSSAPNAWREIPVPQARYQLNVILQNRGFLNARFERDGEVLRVWPGEVTKTQELVVEGGRGILRADKKRKVRGYPMEPAKLDEVTQWADLRMRRNGYACPDIQVTAQAWDRMIKAKIESGEIKTIDGIERTGLEGLNRTALRRFEAFEPGARYDVIDTQITASRMLAQGLFQSAYFTTKCRGDKVDLHLFTAVGKARLVRFGLGASTEELPFADLWFKDTRLDDRASNYTVTLHGSPIRQSLNVNSELYVVPYSLRSFLGPRFKAEHRKERAYELNKVELGADLGRAWDILKVRLQGRVGPTLNYEKTVRGVGPPDTKYLSWEGLLTGMSHAYEAFSRDQYEGWISSLRYRGQREGLGSSLSVDRYDLTFKHLWNVGAFSPPLFIFATRLEAVAVDSKQLTALDEDKNLPVDYRVFYGGDENLRGFARESLNNGGYGYLTALHAGFELRLIEELPFRLEPFLLGDVARLGARRYTVDKPVYTSAGVGLRWPSPFGTLRGSIAQGQVWNSDRASDSYREEWVYFISFGQEF